MIVIVLVALRVAGNRDHAASGLATGDERAGAAMAEDDVSLVQYGADIVERQALVHFPAFGAIAAVADLRDHPLRQQTLLPEGFNALHQPVARSEEHTSELQSLMRISYAVFCFKQKNTTRTERLYTHV